jgi:hypothetical protein
MALFNHPAGTYNAYTSDILKPDTEERYPVGVFQADVESGATLTLQGRADPAAPFVDIESFTADALKEVALAPEMRVVVTGGVAKGYLANWLD